MESVPCHVRYSVVCPLGEDIDSVALHGGRYELAVLRETGYTSDALAGGDTAYKLLGVVHSVPNVEGTVLVIVAHGHTFVGDAGHVGQWFPFRDVELSVCSICHTHYGKRCEKLFHVLIN